jgi:hypothetical protein
MGDFEDLAEINRDNIAEEDQTVAKRRCIQKDNPNVTTVPNLSNNKKYWKEFLKSPCIVDSDETCDICGMTCSNYLPAHNYRLNHLEYTHSLCMYVYLNICGCIICKKIYDFIKSVIKGFNDASLILESGKFEEDYANIEEKITAYWEDFANWCSSAFSDIIGKACISNIVCASDDLVPDLDNPKKYDPVFGNNRKCDLIRIFKMIYLVVIRKYNGQVAIYNEAITLNQQPVPAFPSDYVLISNFHISGLYICIKNIKKIILESQK